MGSKIAFVFPGQGSQYVGMANGVLEYASGRYVLETADRVLAMPLSKIIAEGPEDELQSTVNTQPAIFAVSVAWMQVLREKGLAPAVVAGHSLGEYAAMVCSGALAFEDGLRLVRLRGKLMSEAVPPGQGTMAAILGLSADEVEQLCAEVDPGRGVVPANFNAPGQVVISGKTSLVESAQALSKERGARRVLPLNVSGPFHSPYMKPVGERLREELNQIPVRDPQIPVVANYTGQPVTSAGEVKEALVAGVSSSVLWEQTISYLVSQEVTDFVEVGPGKVLSGLIRRMAKEASMSAVDDSPSWEKLLALGKGDVVR